MAVETSPNLESSGVRLSSANARTRIAAVARLSQWSTFVPYIVVSLLGFLERLPTLNNSIIFIDEPSYLAQAARLDSLYAFAYAFLYRVETKFQLGLVPYIFALDVSQPNAILIVRLLGLLAVIIFCCLMVSISRLAFGRSAPGLFSAVVWLLYLSHDISTFATLLEYFQTPLILLAIWFFIKALQRGDGGVRYLLYAGVVTGLATLVKPPGIMLVPALLIVLIVQDYGLQRRKWRDLVPAGSALAGGAVLPVALFMLPYLLQPNTLREVMFNILTLSSSYAEAIDPADGLLQRVTGMTMGFGTINLLAISSAYFFYVMRQLGPGRKESQKYNSYQLLFLLVSLFLFAADLFGMIKAYYILPLLPLIMLFVAWEVVLFYRRLESTLVKVAFVSVFSLAFTLGNVANLQYYMALSGAVRTMYSQYADPTNRVDTGDLVRFVTANSAPSDYIWVYYNMPEIYWLANRKPATKEPTASWIANVHTPLWFDRTYAELQEDRPKLIIGVDKPTYKVVGREPVTELPEIGALLAQSYDCSREYVAYATICIRKDQ